MEAYYYIHQKKRRSLIALLLIFSFIIGYAVGREDDRPPLNPANFKIKTDLPIEPSSIECSKRAGMPCA